MKKQLILCCVVLLVLINNLAIAAPPDWQNLSAEIVIKRAQFALEELLRADNQNNDYELALLTRLPASLSLPKGKISLEATADNSVRWGGVTPVKVEIKVDGVPRMAFNMAYKVRRFANIVVTNKDLRSGDIAEAQFFALERKEISRNVDYIYDVQSIIGMELKRSVAIGTVMQKSMFSNATLVTKGSNVIVWVQSGRIRLNVIGQALQNGSMDEWIRVRNLNTGKIFVAKVTDKDTLELQLGSGGEK